MVEAGGRGREVNGRKWEGRLDDWREGDKKW